jgi:hypothetical protein
MSQPVELNQSLDEQARQAYLAAMQIEQWIPLSETICDDLEPANEIKETAMTESASGLAGQSNDSEDAVTANDIGDTKATHRETKEVESNQLEINNEQVLSSTEVPPSEANTGAVHSGDIASNNDAANHQCKSSHFLKQVSWSNRVLSEENAKSIMIVCRHQVDQPANSFARVNSPSQFMMDFINALNHFVANDNFELKIQLAHLSAAGLSEDSVPLSQAVNSTRPELMLILGDETVSHLLGDSMEVATCRGQIHQIEDGTKVLVSYHPFSLIENPSLKRLAYEDLNLAREFLVSRN